MQAPRKWEGASHFRNCPRGGGGLKSSEGKGEFYVSQWLGSHDLTVLGWRQDITEDPTCHNQQTNPPTAPSHCIETQLTTQTHCNVCAKNNNDGLSFHPTHFTGSFVNKSIPLSRQCSILLNNQMVNNIFKLPILALCTVKRHILDS